MWKIWRKKVFWRIDARESKKNIHESIEIYNELERERKNERDRVEGKIVELIEVPSSSYLSKYSRKYANQVIRDVGERWVTMKHSFFLPGNRSEHIYDWQVIIMLEEV